MDELVWGRVHKSSEGGMIVKIRSDNLLLFQVVNNSGVNIGSGRVGMGRVQKSSQGRAIIKIRSDKTYCSAVC